MKTHTVSIQEPFFSLIKSGEKDIELRLFDEKRQKIALGDEIIITNGTQINTVIVQGLVRARNFEELFQILDVKRTGMSTTSLALQTMENFYTRAAQDKFGVLGIVIKNKPC